MSNDYKTMLFIVFQFYNHIAMQYPIIKHQICKIVLIIDNHSFLTGHEGEAVAKLDDELFQMSYKTVFKAAFAVHSRQSCELQKVWALEYQVGRKHIVVAQRSQFLLDKFFRLGSYCCPLKEHSVYFLAEFVASPSFRCSHRNIEISGNIILYWEGLNEMRPC